MDLKYFYILLFVLHVKASDYVLWYEKPAATGMNEALVIGNGRIGAQIFGDPALERVSVNEISLWTGDDNPAGKYDSSGTFGDYQVLGNVLIHLNAHKQYTNYKRNLDIGDAISSVQYQSNGTNFKHEFFSSHVSDVLVGQLSADKQKSYTGTIELQDSHKVPSRAANNSITIEGKLSNGLKFEWQLIVHNTGGSLKVNGDHFEFEGCDSLTFIVGAGTDYLADSSKKFRGEGPDNKVTPKTKSASALTYDKLKEDHIKDYHSLFNRVDIDLGTSSAKQKSLPTNTRKPQSATTFDPDFEELLFHMGRYFTISSSRGSLPANLQGMWNDVNNPAWHSDYHTDVNLQMNYWPAEPTNLGECHLPLMNYLNSQVPVWRKQTQSSAFWKTPSGKMTTRGFVTSGALNIYGAGGYGDIPNDKVVNAWFAQHFYEHYAFSMDKTYLKDIAYPYIKEVTEFWDDHLKELNGKLVVPDGWSPEHGPFEDGVSYDQEIIWDLFNNYVKAANALGVDKDYADRVTQMRDRLVVPGVGSFGQLLEWMKEQPGEKTDHHRHTSHLYAVYPGNQINYETNPKLAAAAKISIDTRGISDDSDVKEWSFAWRSNLYARLRDGEAAYKMVKEFVKDRNSCPNLFGLHPPMQIDGSFGITAGIAEMLLQSQSETIEILPAVPKAWANGHVKGLRARGGYEVDIEWTNNTLKDVVIKSVAGSDVKVKYGNTVKTIKIQNQKSVKLDQNLNPI